MNPVTLPRAWAHPSSAAPDQADRRDGSGQGSGGDDEPAWSLHRRCSLSPSQFGGCFLALAVLSALVALFFWAQGARFVTFFAGVEVLALGLAFAFHAVHATDGERVWVQGERLLIERRHGLRHAHEVLDLDGLRVAEAAGGAIELQVGGRSVRIGCHADAARRQQVLADLRRRVRRPMAALPVRT
jgi:uncharacterized membrane protein